MMRLDLRRGRWLRRHRAASLLVVCLAAGCDVSRGETRDSIDARAQAQDSLPLRFTVDASRRFAISPYIYGINEYGSTTSRSVPAWPKGLTLSRFGGNRLSAYNWENNASNAGNDYNFVNDDLLSSSNTPGEAVRSRVATAFAKGAGIIVTVPMLGYVAGDADRTSVGTDPATWRSRLASRFVKSLPRKGAPLQDTPTADDSAVYQDEFVHWLSRKFRGGAKSTSSPIFFDLDNEPDLWGSTHEEVMPKVNGRAATLTYDELIDRTIEYARAIKDVIPEATILGPGTATWAGAATLGRHPSPDPKYGREFFLDVYLKRMRAAEQAEGRRLIDVLDLHWYPAAGAGGQEIGNDMAPQSEAMVRARLQAPRSLWDSTYDERSWVSKVQGGPIRLLPLLREKIARFYPETKIAITEYYYGRGGDISGGIAQADVLGIFGREGVFAATLWPNANLDAVPYGRSPERAYEYVIGAFRMYRDFDGKRGSFGAIGLAAETSDTVGSSVYGSADDSVASRVVLVAINKRFQAREAQISTPGLAGWRTAEIYTLADGVSEPRRETGVALAGMSPLRFTLPPMSVSTIVLRR